MYLYFLLITASLMGLKIKARDDILQDIIRAAKHHPDGWNATFGKDHRSLAHEYYITHPSVGMFVVKEFEKNPFTRKGLGAKLVRHIDEDIQDHLQRNTSDFGILQGNIRKIVYNIKRGIPPETIFEAALQGDDLGLSIPVKGIASRSEQTYQFVHDAMVSQQKHLDTSFERLLADEGMFASYD